MIFIDLARNIAILLALCVGYTMVFRKWDRQSLLGRITVGVIFGIAAVIGMMTPMTFSAGIIFDGRSILISVAGLFGGGLPALIAAIMASVYRMIIGGSGVVMGCGVIMTSAAIGTAYHYLRHKNTQAITSLDLLLFGLVVHVAMLIWTLALPAELRWQVFQTIALPVILAYPVGTVLVGRLLADQDSWSEDRKNLKESEGRFRAAFESSQDCILIWDEHYNYLYANQAAIDHVRVTRDKVVGMTIRDGLGHVPDFMHLWMNRVDQVFETGKPISVQDKTVMQGQFYFTESVLTPIYNSNGNVSAVCVVYRDVTDRKEAEVEREEMIKELGNKNAELERYTYTVSHDLKTPLVTINGFVNILQEDLVEGNADQIKNDIKHICDATKKMSQLLNDLLEISRVGHMVNLSEDVSLVDLVNDVLISMAFSVKAKNVCVNVSPALPVVFGDRQRIEEVMQNLIENAVKYMGDQPAPKIEIGVRSHEGQSVICVSDNGMGIKPEYQENIFGLFNQLDPSEEGTGVGLAIVKRIIECHGGQVWVESEGEGKGSIFCFTLPPGGDAKGKGKEANIYT